MNSKRSITICLLLLQFFCNGQTNVKIDQIKDEAKLVMEKENIPAISLAIITEGDKVDFINLGHFDRTEKQKVDEKSIYQIASLGKTFIGIITNHLMIENVIQLDDPITKYLPFKLSAKRLSKLQSIKIRHLLFHQSGLPRDAKAGYKRKDGDAYNYNYTTQNLEKDVCNLKLKSANKFRYSNFGYALLAYILEQATNKTYEQLLSEYIVKPYHLENTSIQLSTQQQKHLVTPYRKDNRNKKTEPWIMGKLAPPSGVYSTTEDLTKLLIAQLNIYKKFEVDQKPEALYLTQNTIERVKNTSIRYGYGFFEWGMNTYGHGGDMDGYASDYSFNSKNNSGVILLTSSGENWKNPLVRKINQILKR